MDQRRQLVEVGCQGKMSRGILNLYKPVGLTSRQVVDRVGKVLGRKAGHTGTLDPFARGVLLVCWGKATRFTSFFQNLPKVYRAKVRFGIDTDTYDVYGGIKGYTRKELRREELLKALEKYQGIVIQKVPAFSAQKYRGQRLYAYARKGLPVPELTKKVEIYSLELLSCQEGEFGEAELRVTCSSGTYIRSLAFELGRDLGLGAYIFALCREQVGNFTVQDSVDVFTEGVTAMFLEAQSLPIDKGLYWIPSLVLDKEEARRFSHGSVLRKNVLEKEGWFKVYRENRFLGLGEVRGTTELQPRIILVE